ncbi:glycerol-3-phosphate dehydrogenase subunit GlpB [Vibrio nomapromontoriensis]|uniref:glycerol-3-phosphate dehydrogenase subunit GlpB n=1 Tax=Vibrio nomapromontoriensis TaxID=2910246 RepID=UPI003D151F38
MIHYDVIVIGGGMAGYCSAIRALQAGLNTALISRGQSALHFASGSIDVLSHSPISGDIVTNPLKAIEHLEVSLTSHPYSKVGVSGVKHALDWFINTIVLDNNVLTSRDRDNHFRLTPIGTLKATWSSQQLVKKFAIDLTNLNQNSRVQVFSFQKFHDFQPSLFCHNLALLFEDEAVDIQSQMISLANALNDETARPLRSTDLQGRLNEPHYFDKFKQQLLDKVSQNDLIILPAVFGDGDAMRRLNHLQQEHNLDICLVPTLAPSLLGINIESQLSKVFIQLGGTHLKGDSVINAHRSHDNNGIHISSIQTHNLGNFELKAENYILATGSFFSNGLTSDHQQIIEPIFNLDVHQDYPRSQWHHSILFSNQSQPYLSYGVKTNPRFQPFISEKVVNNLFCCGSILADYDPIAQGCGGGVAISTAVKVAEQIIANTQIKTTSNVAVAAKPHSSCGVGNKSNHSPNKELSL